MKATFKFFIFILPFLILIDLQKTQAMPTRPPKKTNLYCKTVLELPPHEGLAKFDPVFADTDIARVLPWKQNQSELAGEFLSEPITALQRPGIQNWSVAIDRRGLMKLTVLLDPAHPRFNELHQDVINVIIQWAKGTIQAKGITTNDSQIVIHGIFDEDVSAKKNDFDGTSSKGGRAEFLRRADHYFTGMEFERKISDDWVELTKTNPAPYLAAGYEASGQAATALMKRLVEELEPRQNFGYFPSSFFETWMAVLAGASGKVEQEMLSIFGVEPQRAGEMLLGASAMHKRINSLSGISSANAILVNAASGAVLKNGYRQALEQLLGAKIEAADFANPATTENLNQLVLEKSGISNLVDKLDPETVLVVLNAMRFKALWKNPFDKKLTQRGPFEVAPGKFIDAQMMNQRNSFAVFQDHAAGVSGIRLDTAENSAVSIDLFLPDAKLFGGKKLASMTDIRQIKKWIGALNVPERKKQAINLYLPRFKIEYANENLISVLQGLNVRLPFSTVDGFGKMVDGPLMWSKLIQKNLFEVDEEGARGGGVTAAFATRGPGPQVLKFDRPFVVVLRVYGEPEYIGIVSDPSL